MDMSHLQKGFLPFLGFVVVLGLASCDGGGNAKQAGNNAAKGGVRASLLTVEFGRVVDVYAYRRVDSGDPDRLVASKRRPVLIERDVLISPQVQNEDPFATGAARYRFMPYDPAVGHRELLILFDDRHPAEKQAFDRALASAKAGLISVAPYNAFNKGNSLPPPAVPADAGIKLTFDRPLGLDSSYFVAHPSAVQVLRLAGDPAVLSPSQAYGPVSVRVVSKENGRYLIIDPEVTGREARGRSPNPVGLPASLDNKTANIRIALPTSGVVAKTFRISADNRSSLNSVGMNGEQVVIRDFRAGNPKDPNRGYLPSREAPEIVARKPMGILDVDLPNRRLLLNKRFADVILRGRIPFVDGPLSAIDKRPRGGRFAPQGRPFAFGDVVFQDVLSPTGESVRLKGEIIVNEDIPVAENDKNLGVGGGNPTVWVQVDKVEAFDSQGNRVTFQASNLPLGADCEVLVHYHDVVKVKGNTKDVGDSGRLAEFFEFDPAPPRIDPDTRQLLAPNENVSPMASVIVRFSKPMVFDSIRPEDNLVLANRLGAKLAFIDHVKVGNLAVWPSLKADPDNDATGVRLSGPMGFFHQKSKKEVWYIHVKDGPKGPLDRAGNELDLFNESESTGITSSFTLDPKASDNLVGAYLQRMNSPDEDGTKDGSLILDYFGQFQQREGKLYGWPTFRFSKNADSQTLPNVLRGTEGSCTQVDPNTKVKKDLTPFPPLYLTPTMIVNLPPLAGGIAEPFIPQGSRLQMTYREDDFQLDPTSVTDLAIDVEQLHWAPFIGRKPTLLTFDVFDRMSIVLSTSEKRPDMYAAISGPRPKCLIVGGYRSGLVANFEKNYLDNAPRVQVVKDRVYKINPNDSFLGATGVTYIPYPKFAKSYTWRDWRIPDWDSKNDRVIGYGGAQDPNNATNPDTTKSCTSPWIPEADVTDTNPKTYKSIARGINNRQPDDFLGTKTQDFNPIALPLLVDFFVFPDDAQNGFAKGDNLFQIGYIGPIWPTPLPPHGYYNSQTSKLIWPWLRVHSTGGIDNQNTEHLVDPVNEKVAQGGWILNTILGRFKAPPGDDHIYWAQADFVRKVSVVTHGYVDLLQPGKNAVLGPNGWPRDPNGFPNLALLGPLTRPVDFAVLLDPPLERLPDGTSIKIEFRGAQSFSKSDTLYVPTATETAASRGNLLNPNYACEQYRYEKSDRVAASGLTPYVKHPKLLIDRTGKGPRFLNWRFSFYNNTKVTPARVPFIDSFAIVYRVSKN